VAALRLVIGKLTYRSDMSSVTVLCVVSIRSCVGSVASSNKCFIAKVWDRASLCVSFRMRNLASLYDGAGILLITGRIGLFGLWVLTVTMRRGLWVSFGRRICGEIYL
jgi:hypothetical protein